MDGLSVLFAVLTVGMLIVIVAINTMNSLNRVDTFKMSNEGFENSSKSNIPQQIRTVLDTMNAPELCGLFDTLRKNIAENEKAGQDIPQEEVVKRVEKALSLKIPGGALPCPLFKYPREGSSDTDWLEFLKTIPPDFGARVVLMAVFANQQLTEIEANVRKSLSDVPGVETFLMRPPDIPHASLEGFEDSDDIQENVKNLLKTLVANKATILKSNKIDPAIDIRPLIAQAKKSAEFLNKKRAQAETGTLIKY